MANDVLPVADLSASGQDHRILHDLAHDGILKRINKMANDVLPVADLSTSGQDHRILHDLPHDRILKD